jgi:hypothetical protein
MCQDSTHILEIKKHAEKCCTNMETNAVCCDSHTRHINTLCGQNAEFLMLNVAVRKPTSRV